MSDTAVYLKPGDILYVLYKDRARIHTYETVQIFVIVDGRLVGGKLRHFSSKEVRDLRKKGNGSLLDGFRAERILTP
jgi:hypothetical protein